jgi:hypothetical protein
MSPEEYRKALQESVLERQRQRTAGNSDIARGKKATWDYRNVTVNGIILATFNYWYVFVFVIT